MEIILTIAAVIAAYVLGYRRGARRKAAPGQERHGEVVMRLAGPSA